MRSGDGGGSRAWAAIDGSSAGSAGESGVLASPEMDSSDELHPAIRGLKTVCRCNNIKYRTIERAIREGAHTLGQIAARTTATTGQCGGSCTPDVQQMLAELLPKHATRAAAAAAANPDAWWVRKK
jgi:NAD(P)H-nitrite reductase large subunit